MTAPVRTEEQRAAALVRALEVRRDRAWLRLELKSGRASGVAVVREAGRSDRWRGLRVRWLLESLPGIGPARADAIMLNLAITESRRLGGLTDRQRERLLEVIG